MGIRLLSFIITAFLLNGCRSSDSKNELVGNWYGIEPDSEYYELYINDSVMVLNHKSFGPVLYDYFLNENHVIVSNAAGVERVWELEVRDPKSIVLSDSLETKTYTRLDLDMDFFESIEDSLAYIKFQENFIARHLIKSIKP